MLNFAQTLTSTTETPSLWAGGFFFVWVFIFFLIAVIALWKVFEKAGYDGWKAIIPIYNTYVLVKIAGRPDWWFVLLLIPFVNFVVYIILSMDIAKAFGKSELFGIVGLWLFSFIGFAILGWGDATYQLPKSAQAPSSEE